MLPPSYEIRIAAIPEKPSEARTTMVTLRELANDPDFAEMLETDYAASFHLPD